MKGETITLIHRTPAGHDPGGGIIWDTEQETVEDVLIQDAANRTSPTASAPTASESPKPSTCPAHGPTGACAGPRRSSTASHTP